MKTKTRQNTYFFHSLEQKEFLADTEYIKFRGQLLNIITGDYVRTYRAFKD